MKKIKIVTDSSCNMDYELAEKLGIHIVSLSVMIDDIIYKDMDLTGQKFMEMMSQSHALPKTSQPPIGEFVELYDELGQDGSEVLSIHMNEILSGTVSAARQAAQITKTNVTVIDSKFTDQALAFQVVKAAEMAEAGSTMAEILAELEKVKENTLLYIGVASLDNLVKGGRISRATGILSNIFNIRVVMQLLDSELVTQAKDRGAKAFNKWFAEMKESISHLNQVKKIGLTHADGLATAEAFATSLKELFPAAEITIREANSIIATHTGSGAFAIMIYSE